MKAQMHSRPLLHPRSFCSFLAFGDTPFTRSHSTKMHNPSLLFEAASELRAMFDLRLIAGRMDAALPGRRRALGAPRLRWAHPDPPSKTPGAAPAWASERAMLGWRCCLWRVCARAGPQPHPTRWVSGAPSFAKESYVQPATDEKIETTSILNV